MKIGKFLLYNSVLHFFADVLLYPPDLISTRLQVQSPGKSTFPQYKSATQALRTIIKQEGFAGLYKGFVVSEVGWATSHICYYLMYELVKEKVRSYMPQDTHSNIFSTSAVAGMAANLACLVITVPSKVLSQNLQVQGPFQKPLSAKETFNSLWKTGGFKSVYRGFGATIATEPPISALWWVSYETIKDFFCSHPDVLRPMIPYTVKDNILTHAFCSCFASLLTTTVANPINVAVTRLQVFNPQGASEHEKMKHKNVLRIMKYMLKEEGVISFTKGVKPALLVSAPSAMISICIYEYSKKISLV
eukprot:TRINITY_DN610_c0_g3_i1.p1 TRINITY_DN610_c0_g3~~TRINITY_DN610_c0_g3_i1.p1  ORF type:complete len:334 (-),score=59.47 TRINITY_DN610_c0_g3_i1:305-1216(-)